jgi:6-pyruvoyltetrahydropterin/6-carboxytetrahydropterin synthase
MRIYRAFTFDAAHRLPNLPSTHKCSNLHGHTFRVEIHVNSELNVKFGWVMDFGDIKGYVEPLIDELDHHYLNDIEGLENPTSENISKWLWKRIQPNLPILTKIVVQESPNSGAICYGDDM